MLRSFLALLSLLALPFALGCGQGRVPPDPITFPVTITDSPELATGAWTFVGDPVAGNSTVYPIGGFAGALTATGTRVIGSFVVGSSDSATSPLPSNCLGKGSYASSIVNFTGTASGGKLTLDGTLVDGHVHLTAQLSADRKSVASGGYTITGACATTATTLEGYYNAPVTGTYIGQITDNNGQTQTMTASLTQERYFYSSGTIPVDGTLSFAAACPATAKLNGAYVLGYISQLAGMMGPGPGNDTYFFTAEDDVSSRTISIDAWGYVSPSCGTFTGANQTMYLYKQ